MMPSFQSTTPQSTSDECREEACSPLEESQISAACDSGEIRPETPRTVSSMTVSDALFRELVRESFISELCQVTSIPGPTTAQRRQEAVVGTLQACVYQVGGLAPKYTTWTRTLSTEP